MTGHPQRTALLALILSALACSKSSGGQGAADAARAVDATGDADAADPCIHPAVPGIRVCCGQPGEMQGANCVPRQLIDENLANCVTEGRSFDAKFSSFGVFCCAGLTRIEEYFPIEAGTGDPGLPAGCSSGPPSVKRCAKCGDGACGPAENRCNCPADCGP